MNTPTPGMLGAMLELQANMNQKIDTDWLAKRHAYLRAVLVEATEALEHYGWKWWKKQTPDMAQLRIEMIDIWHFVLSEYLLRAGGDKTAATQMLLAEWNAAAHVDFDGARYELNALDIRQQLELLAALAAVRRLCMPLVARLFAECALAPKALFRDYVSKNVLNHFRQDRGYKTGTYKKTWDGAEDNVHMAQILETLTVADAQLPAALYQALAGRYDTLHAAGKLA
ncbi:MAG: dUTP diphosphatase [Betaproteobacteria bacterium]|nr:dUTP diphosphatase [Betaproteobacteria bacterium]